MPTVSQYYPGDLYGDAAESLEWLYSRQENSAAQWEANALETGFPLTLLPGAPAVPTAPPFIECGLYSENDLGTIAQTICESIAVQPPAIVGLLPDDQLGPDGFPIDYSPIGLPWGNLLAGVLPVTSAQIAAYYTEMIAANPSGTTIYGSWTNGVNSVHYDVLAGLTVYGYLFNPQKPITSYRIDLFSVSDKFYYQGSAPGVPAYTYGNDTGQLPTPSQFQSLMVQQGLYGWWAAQVTVQGVVIAVLYPTTVAQPSSGWSGSALPAGWICHSNTGVGYKLSNYFARIYSDTTGETLLEDNIPIIVQDDYHARAGSSVALASGTPTVHIIYVDPVNGPTLVYSSLEAESAFETLPLSYIVPTSDPLWVPDPTSSMTPAPQDRSSIYDCALGIMVFSASGNFIAAARIVKELDSILAIPPGAGPAGSLSLSYDTYHGQVDQSQISVGAMAWVCYAYSVYMQLSGDYTPALSLQTMLDYLLSLESSAADLTNGLFCVSGVALTRDNVILYFAFMRAAGILATAAIQLLKTGSITSVQAAALNTTVGQVSTAAGTMATKLVANLYIAPSGSVPGHFAQGASSAGLNTSQDCQASGAWAAIFSDSIGRDDLALQCLEFVDQNFLLSGQTIVKSAVANSYNEAYQQPSAFSGFKPFNDSGGGYSGSPLSVSQEGTWSMILALLLLYHVSGVSSYFAGPAHSGSSLDAYLTTLVTGQRTVGGATGDGSLLAFSRASRASPYDFFVWPAFTATAWFCLVSTNPGLLLSVANSPTVIPYLQIPQGVSQQVNELEGESSLGSITITCIDPSGTLKGLAAQDALVGRMLHVRQGFPGMALGDFTILHTMQITQVGQDTSGRISIQCTDVQRFIAGTEVWERGGPLWWTPGGAKAQQPIGPSWLENGYPVSDQNPRYVAGNPIDIILAVLQNELGVGQDPALMMTNYIMQSLVPVYQNAQDYEPAPPPEGWVIYKPGQNSTLINPNPYIDVPGFLALRDGEFSGVWFDFVITRPIDGKQFIEEQILKPFGLYTIVRSDGQLSLKTMKPPVEQTPVFAFSAKNIMGIPQTAEAKHH